MKKKQFPKNEIQQDTSIKLYNPAALDHRKHHRIKSIELNERYTRIDFLYRSSELYINGGWIQIDKDTIIRDSRGDSYYLYKAYNIPYAPNKLYFSACGQLHHYTLVFPPLPKHVRSIDIIEKEAPGTYFNFYNVRFAKWMQLEHPLDLSKCKN